MAEIAKTVRLNQDVMDRLATKRIGYESPNDTLNRILDQKHCSVDKTMSEKSDTISEEGD